MFFIFVKYSVLTFSIDVVFILSMAWIWYGESKCATIWYSPIYARMPKIVNKFKFATRTPFLWQHFQYAIQCKHVALFTTPCTSHDLQQNSCLLRWKFKGMGNCKIWLESKRAYTPSRVKWMNESAFVGSQENTGRGLIPVWRRLPGCCSYQNGHERSEIILFNVCNIRFNSGSAPRFRRPF